jgi:hypothetical protein
MGNNTAETMVMVKAEPAAPDVITVDVHLDNLLYLSNFSINAAVHCIVCWGRGAGGGLHFFIGLALHGSCQFNSFH